jgi:hypothetical protein
MARRPAILALTILAASWYGMMLVHELGHVLAAWATGSTISAVRVPWVGFSQTEIARYGGPAWAVVAAGPVLGVLVPAAAWGLGRVVARGWVGVPLLRFFAGFCLVANGWYMASALVDPAGDAGDLAALGVPRWAVAVPGILAAASGFAVWHGLGLSFGPRGGQVGRGMLTAAGVGLAVVLILVAAANLR